MSFTDPSRTLPNFDIKDFEDEEVKMLASRIKSTLSIIETWLNDLAVAINTNAGAPEVVDTFADLPPFVEAAGRIYYLQTTAYLGKRYYASDGAAWFALD